MKNLLLTLFIGVFIVSCSIQKRQHLPGYYITYHKNYTSNEADKDKNQLQEDVTENNVLAENINVEQITPEQHSLLDELITENEEFVQLNLSKLSANYIQKNKRLNPEVKAKSAIFFNDIKIKKRLRVKKIINDENDDEENKNLAIAGFILSIVGIVLGPLFSIAGLILCRRALKKMAPDTKYRKLAKAGLIISIVTLALLVLTIILFFVLLFYVLKFYW